MTTNQMVFSQSNLDCKLCHNPIHQKWISGSHSDTQMDVTDELAEALDYFFSTENGLFSSATASLNKDQWPDVACISCHNPHEPNTVYYFNSNTKNYEAMNSADELCGQCRGNLRFPDTDHLSYNILKGMGAIGVQFKQTMPEITCTDCHMYASDVEESNSTMYHGHNWSIFVEEEDGSETVSCQACHQEMDATVSQMNIETYQDEAQARLDSAGQKFALAESQMEGNTDANLQAKLAEAETNLSLVEGDESGGFHNHKYQMDLLANVIQNANDILAATGVQEYTSTKLPRTFALLQNFPNPFNPSTKIDYMLPNRAQVTLEVFNLLGEKVKTLVNSQQNAGVHSIIWNARNDLGKEVPNSIYFYRITTDKYKDTKKMSLLK